MKDGKEYELDVLVLATGFDAITGGMTQIDIRDINGVSIKERWSQGVYSYLGVAISGFPNLFYLQGAQSPVAASNAPTTNEIQGDWIADTIDYMEKNKFKRIEANREAEIEYKNHINNMASLTLMPTADRLVTFTITGDNLPEQYPHISASTWAQTFPASLVKFLYTSVAFLSTPRRLEIAPGMVTKGLHYLEGVI
jgi:hypothetical protein